MTRKCETCGAAFDPKGTRRRFCSERCRKRQYDLECVDCGGRVDGTTPSKLPDEPRCFACTVEHRKRIGSYVKVWPRDRILECIVSWNREHGEPPAIADWCAQAAIQKRDIERAKRALSLRGSVPTVTTVYREFGSWNDAIEAAGLTPRAGHGGAGNELRRRKRAA